MRQITSSYDTMTASIAIAIWLLTAAVGTAQALSRDPPPSRGTIEVMVAGRLHLCMPLE